MGHEKPLCPWDVVARTAPPTASSRKWAGLGGQSSWGKQKDLCAQRQAQCPRRAGSGHTQAWDGRASGSACPFILQMLPWACCEPAGPSGAFLCVCAHVSVHMPERAGLHLWAWTRMCARACLCTCVNVFTVDRRRGQARRPRRVLSSPLTQGLRDPPSSASLVLVPSTMCVSSRHVWGAPWGQQNAARAGAGRSDRLRSAVCGQVTCLRWHGRWLHRAVRSQGPVRRPRGLPGCPVAAGLPASAASLTPWSEQPKSLPPHLA